MKRKVSSSTDVGNRGDSPEAPTPSPSTSRRSEVDSFWKVFLSFLIVGLVLFLGFFLGMSYLLTGTLSWDINFSESGQSLSKHIHTLVESVNRAREGEDDPILAFVNDFFGSNVFQLPSNTPRHDGEKEKELTLFTKEELALYDGSDENLPIYISVLGHMYVTTSCLT
eukprot:TRINITY_DN1077_c0_g1_i2.p1 TRINITY_DN1077_c0_g1~~TRINITY_DN1077_c0_g1_i2.p1  ORF type:complete len:168 (-),score=39.32 TRINITY_DN1077_c0_g1_i2:391-894(-)